MKIKFDSNQEFQLDAIRAVVDVFDGQPLARGEFEIRLDAAGGEFLSEFGVGNLLTLDDGRLFENVRIVQGRNNLNPNEKLEGRNFSVEMETGTGKTYVYLRTIYELRKQYGFKKFIIVVPSVAIREGVQKNIELTADHFRDIYGNEPIDCWVYDSKQVSRLRQFAGSNQLQVLIINIDAFNKKTNNVIHRENDRLSGRKPIEFIQAANPIVIVDEPQNMESDRARSAIESLNPLCTLRYSATHRNLYNQLYRLDPVRAYDLKLVKRIEVDSILEEEDFNKPYIRVRSIRATKSKITASLEIDVQEVHGPKRKTITVSRGGVDLFEKSNKRLLYEGYIIDEINAGSGFISFRNGITLSTGETHGGLTDAIMRVQVRETVKEHLEKELRFKNDLPPEEEIKVLSLFFIDRVANYVNEDGKIRKWFIEAYTEMAARERYRSLNLPSVDKVHNGYFAESKGVARDTSGKSKADDDAYVLIMRDKERLLSLDEPLRFIFSHSALREGWDNPNVFQICTLNETKSEIKKRQEIGRGLRLPVMKNGERCFDANINRLTLIANENYDDFAKKLQTEIADECGVDFSEGRIKNKRKQKVVRLKKGWKLNPEFKELWNRIKHRTRYSVRYETEVLIEKAARAMKRMDEIEAPRIRREKARIGMTAEGIETTVLSIGETKAAFEEMPIPDLLGYLQRQTELTRTTLARILIESGRLADVRINPQQFLDQATRTIQSTLNQLIIDGIKYEKIAGAEYEMLLFEEPEIIGYLDRLVTVDHSIYETIEFESNIEKEFAEALDAREDIKLFIKLPGWFKVETPIGTYNPDWAIVKQEEGAAKKLYLVRETKATKDQLQLRGSEWAKIQCGTAHFEALDVSFKHITSAAEV